MKQFVMVTGAPGVGKTTVCRELFSMTEGCAWLDSDWCWTLNPWHAKSDTQKAVVEENFGRILRSYFEDDATSTILFNWVMPHSFMFDLVLRQLDGLDYRLVKIALVCEKQKHMERMRQDGRGQEQAENPDDMKQYCELGATVIDVTAVSARDAARQIKDLLDQFQE